MIRQFHPPKSAGFLQCCRSAFACRRGTALYIVAYTLEAICWQANFQVSTSSISDTSNMTKILLIEDSQLGRVIARDALEAGPQVFSAGSIQIDLRRRSVSVADSEIKLTPTEFRTLALLVREPGRTFSRDQIIDKVFGYDFDGFDRTVDAHVSSLRRKLDAAPGGAKHIETIYGSGYRFNDG